MRLSCHLREFRHKTGIGIREMSERSGISRGILSLIERGRLLPTDRETLVLAKFYAAPLASWYEGVSASCYGLVQPTIYSDSEDREATAEVDAA